MSSYQTKKTPGDTAWFTHDRFGMFIHWGLYAMVYTYTHFADTALHMDTLASFDLWLADYRGKRPARRHGMWQYTSRGRVPGISGPVDLSRTKKDYPALLHRAGLDRTIL